MESRISRPKGERALHQRKERVGSAERSVGPLDAEQSWKVRRLGIQNFSIGSRRLTKALGLLEAHSACQRVLRLRSSTRQG